MLSVESYAVAEGIPVVESHPADCELERLRCVMLRHFPEAGIDNGCIKFDPMVGKAELKAAATHAHPCKVTAARTNTSLSAWRGDVYYEISVGPAAMLLSTPADLASIIAHELAHVVRIKGLFERHPYIPKSLLIIYHKIRKRFVDEESKVDELCRQRGIEVQKWVFLDGSN